MGEVILRTITILAYNRPHYLEQCLDALAKCRGIEEYGILISVDGGGDHKNASKPTTFDCEVVYLKESYGIDEHNKVCYDAVFRNGAGKIDFNIALEDDVILTPDALELANWFYDHPKRDEYAFLNLGDPAYRQVAKEEDYPTVRETRSLYTSAWCFTDKSWVVMREFWNRPLVTQLGWDWSLSYTINEHNWRGLAPIVSRARNIGREGVHAYPAWFDIHVALAAFSDGRESGFRIERHFEGHPDWFTREVNAQYGRHERNS